MCIYIYIYIVSRTGGKKRFSCLPHPKKAWILALLGKIPDFRGAVTRFRFYHQTIINENCLLHPY